MELAAVGDVMLEHVFSPREAPFDRAFRILSEADLVFANLETPFGVGGHPREKMYAFRGDPSVAEVLRSAAFDVVSVANNHMLDYGEQVLFETLDILSKMKIPYVGAGRNLREADQPVILASKGIKVAFIGLAATLPLGAAASSNRPGIAPVHVSTSYEIDPTLLQEQPGNPAKTHTQVDERDVDRICEIIRQARRGADHVIVGIHWGVAFAKDRAEYQQPLGRKMIDAGASLIVGHHSHVRQGVELYGNGAILYSLGDFVFHDRVDMTGESGMIATVELDKKKISNLKLRPITVDTETGLPILGGKKEAKQLLEEIRALGPTMSLSLAGNAVTAKA